MPDDEKRNARERRFQPPTNAQHARKKTVPALTSEVTFRRSLKRKFGERSAKRAHKHAQEPPANEFAAPK